MAKGLAVLAQPGNEALRQHGSFQVSGA